MYGNTSIIWGIDRSVKVNWAHVRVGMFGKVVTNRVNKVSGFFRSVGRYLAVLSGNTDTFLCVWAGVYHPPRYRKQQPSAVFSNSL